MSLPREMPQVPLRSLLVRLYRAPALVPVIAVVRGNQQRSLAYSVL